MKIGDRAEVPSTPCPNCGYLFDSASYVSNSGTYAFPEAGDASICIRCGVWLIYTSDLTMRRMEIDDVVALNTEQHKALTRLSRVIKQLRDKTDGAGN